MYDIWVIFPRTGKMSKMWRFFYFGSFTVTKPDKIDFQWVWGKTTIGNNGFR